MFSRSGPKGFKPDLKKTLALCEHLGNPEKKFKSIHIAGTNGKGSVSNMLAAIFQEHGYKTGLYTSPHLHDFRERIRVNGRMISKRAVIGFVKRTHAFAQQINPSFFELTFGMAMDYFAAEKIDIAIIETGLGGRLDSTNVITPELSIITNIGMDHTDVLGDTLEKIAFEKAGIIKKQVPVIVGEYLPETKPVFLQKAVQEHAPICFAADNYVVSFSQDNEYADVLCQKTGMHHRYFPDLKGSYQEKNLATVLQSVEALQEQFRLEPGITAKALAHVAGSTGLQGRWQVIRNNPLVVLDVAHNADGIKYLVKQAAETPHRQLHIVMGIVKDKDVAQVLKLLPKDAKYYFTNAQMARALPAADLKKQAVGYGLSGDVYSRVNEAVSAALRRAGTGDMIVICGSVFVVAEVDLKMIKSGF